MTCSSSPLLTVLVALLALASTASAHFTLSGPVRSREGAMWPNDNRKYFPIGGTTSPRPILDCLDIPKSKSPSDTATLRAGSTLDLGFEIGNGARHVGICTATLVDAKTRRELHRFEDEKDCVNRRDAMKISLPASKTCDDCVIVVKVAATHISAENPEFFDSCMDVRVVGGSEPYVPGQPGQQRPPTGGRNQRQPTPTPAPAPAPAPQPEPQPIEAPAPQPEPIVAPAPQPEPIAAPAPIQQRPPVSGGGARACAEHGKMQCRRDGKKFRQCVHGAWVEQDVPAGTKCVLSGSSISIAHVQGSAR